MNIICKIIFNINIVKFLFIHVAIDFNENHIKNVNEVLENNGFIVNFGNDNTWFILEKSFAYYSNGMQKKSNVQLIFKKVKVKICFN
jgi:hypothetical protein